MIVRATFLSLIASVLLFVQGCATPPRLPAVPSELTAKAAIPGMPSVRFAFRGDMTDLTQLAHAALTG